MTPHTFITDENRNGRPWRATGYVCRHGVQMRFCPEEPDGAVVEEAMVAWWNESFTQMQDRLTVRDNILHGT